MLLSIRFAPGCVSTLGTLSRSRPEYPLEADNRRGELNCTLNANSEVVADRDEIKAKRLMELYRSVMDYFVQIGCRKSTMSNTGSSRWLDLPECSAIKGRVLVGGKKRWRLRAKSTVTSRHSLDGSEQNGHCSNLELLSNCT